MALAWREDAAAPPVATQAEGLQSSDYVTLDMEKTARARYCSTLGGTVIGEQAIKCDFGLCTGANDDLCGIREVVCDDVPDAHQCGLMGRERGSAPRSGEHGPADAFDQRTAGEL